MALQNQKRCTLRCFRASENLEKSSESGQNADKSSILHVFFCDDGCLNLKSLQIYEKMGSKNSKNDPKTAPWRPSRKMQALQNYVWVQVWLQNPQKASKRPPRGPRKASKGPQEAAKKLPNDPPKHLKDNVIECHIIQLIYIFVTILNIILSPYLIAYLLSYSLTCFF